MSARDLPDIAAPFPLPHGSRDARLSFSRDASVTVRSDGHDATQRSFAMQVEDLFRTEVPRLQRVVTRLSGDGELAADVVQDAFVRLYRRGFLPDQPRQWLITVVLNLYRNAATTSARQHRLLSAADDISGGERPSTDVGLQLESDDARRLVRAALSRMPERECRLLMLLGDGYSYREIAGALELSESSVGTLLARAKRLFRESYGAA